MSKSLSGSDRIAGYLGQVCMMTGGDGHLVRRSEHVWVSVKAAAAKSLLKEKYASVGDVKIEERQIDEVFARNSLPVIDGVLASQVGSTWVEFNGRFYLNMGFAPRLAPGEINDDTRAIINFISSNLLRDYRPAEESTPTSRTPRARA